MPNQHTSTLPAPTALAEQGKLHALNGEHALALAYYRAAMQQATSNEAADRILSRHFAECALESFEKMKDWTSVLAYCERSLAHYEAHPPASIIAWKDLAHIYQKYAVVLIKADRKEEAVEPLRKAQEIAKKEGLRLPLIDSLNNWLRAQYHIDERHLEALLNQKQYYTVTHETVDHRHAAPLPSGILKTFQTGLGQ